MLMALLKFLSPFKFINDLEQLYKCNLSTSYILFRHKLILLDKDTRRKFLSSVQPIETQGLNLTCGHSCSLGLRCFTILS